MPIYDASYRRYQARAPLHAWRFWPVAREALRQILVRRMLIVLLVLAWLPILYPGIQIFIVARVPNAAPLLRVHARIFGNFLGMQVYLALLLTLFGGAGLVANDLNSGGILLYLSRAISRRDYVLGKLACVGLLNLTVTLAPATLLYVLAVSLLPQVFFTWQQAWVLPAIVAQSLLVTLLLSVVVLAVSSLTRRGWVAGIAFFALLMGLDFAQGLLGQALGLQAVALLSPLSSLRIVDQALFDLSSANGVHWAWALVALATVALAALAVLRRRVRAVEIVT